MQIMQDAVSLQVLDEQHCCCCQRRHQARPSGIFWLSGQQFRIKLYWQDEKRKLLKYPAVICVNVISYLQTFFSAHAKSV